MKLIVNALTALIVLTGQPPGAEAADIGFGIHLGHGGSYGSWGQPWRNEWRDPWRSDWRGDDWRWRRGFERREHLGFEITTPDYRYYDRWHDPAPEWQGPWGSPSHWNSGEPRFEYRAEPRRPLPTPPSPAKKRMPPSPTAAPAPEPKPEPEPIDSFEGDGEENTLYYCPSARAYYPAVRDCPGGWREEKGVKVQ